MTIARWTPSVAPTRQEQFLLKRVRLESPILTKILIEATLRGGSAPDFAVSRIAPRPLCCAQNCQCRERGR
jgi:hypothetical protein